MKKANAFFGIKATGWKGKVYSSKTKECYDGRTYTDITAAFRAYDTPAESVSDYFDLMEAARYKACLTKATVKECITEIKKGGYATSPTYINTIVTIYENNKTQIESYKVEEQRGMIKNNLELVQAAVNVARNMKTLYVMGGWGVVLNASGKQASINAYAYNRRSDRKAKILAQPNDTFGFDCVCFVKSLLWGFTGNKNLAHGGASYASNGVPDIGEGSMINVCKNVSTNFKNIMPGEFLWMSGHCGIYIGDGLAVESTPIWKDGVQITAVGNIGKKAGYNTRTWVKHGKLPYIAYVGTDQTTPTVDPLAVYSNTELANMVLLGQFGNGAQRKQTLGTRYAAVQAIVDDMLKTKPAENAQAVTYTVKRGDTLTSIAKAYGTTVKKIAEDNDIKNVNLIRVGQVLKV